jgi:hypothetical protein
MMTTDPTGPRVNLTGHGYEVTMQDMEMRRWKLRDERFDLSCST